MRKKVTIFILVLFFTPVAVLVVHAHPHSVDVKKIHGRIQFVDAFPDYRVRIFTASFADLRVQMVKNFADSPGKWQAVDAFPDYKIQVVTVGEDFTIQYVTSFPGPSK